MKHLSKYEVVRSIVKVLYIPFGFSGILIGSFVLFIFIKYRKNFSNSKSQKLILCLAIVNTLSSMIYGIENYWRNSKTSESIHICGIYDILLAIFIESRVILWFLLYFSNHIVMIISIERYMIVCHTIFYHKYISLKHYVVVLINCALISGFLSLQNTIITLTNHGNLLIGPNFSNDNFTIGVMYGLLIFIIVFILPMIIHMFCYHSILSKFKILSNIHKTEKQIIAGNANWRFVDHSMTKQSEHIRKNISKFVMLMCSVYFILWLPINIVLLFSYFKVVVYIDPTYYQICLFCVYFNTLLNTLTYVFSSNEFKYCVFKFMSL
ncbi:hypothetical protein A3Q56_00945 [Intoshia linei]|uniref:G-protein coupled receptors family 1 profile domain-containing protein n=1 Tax=Intoshia linei TaxID=1819745 RepID=A0A177BCA6_9BILA|nr:hypothetical protein A3Q56_00945 [Intoshia linei]